MKKNLTKTEDRLKTDAAKKVLEGKEIREPILSYDIMFLCLDKLVLRQLLVF